MARAHPRNIPAKPDINLASASNNVLFKLYHTENSKARGQIEQTQTRHLDLACSLTSRALRVIAQYQNKIFSVVVVVVYVHGKHLRSCLDGQLI